MVPAHNTPCFTLPFNIACLLWFSLITSASNFNSTLNPTPTKKSYNETFFQSYEVYELLKAILRGIG